MSSLAEVTPSKSRCHGVFCSVKLGSYRLLPISLAGKVKKKHATVIVALSVFTHFSYFSVSHWVSEKFW